MFELTHFNPGNIFSLERDLQFLNRPANLDFFSNFFSYTPRSNVVRNDDEIRITLEIAGIDPAEISIFLEENELIVSGERKNETFQEDDLVVRREIHSGSFTQKFAIPHGVAFEDISAEIENGILTILINNPPVSEARKIEVTVK